jgi:hypothetical protein
MKVNVLKFWEAPDCNSVYAGSIPTRASIFTL